MQLKSLVLKLISRLFALVPESDLKNQFRCWKANRTAQGYRVSFLDGRWRVDYPDCHLLFRDNPCTVLATNQFYLKHHQLQPGQYIIDGGANIGAFALLAAKRVGPLGRVYAYEPDHELHDKLKEAVQENHLTNVILREVGIWSQPACLPFFRSSRTNLANGFYPLEQTDQILELNVNSLDLENELWRWPRVDLVKLNIEGSEIQALAGARKVLGQHRPNLAIATDHWLDGSLTSQTVESELKLLGYLSSTERTTFVYEPDFEYITTYGRAM